MYPEILLFTSKHCAPCRTAKKLMEKVNLSLFGNKLNIKIIDIDKAENMETAKKYGIMAVPTIIIGNKRLSGIIEEDDLVDAIIQGFISSVKLEEE